MLDHFLMNIYQYVQKCKKNDAYLLLSEGGIIRPCDLRMWTSFTCLASLCTLGKGGTVFFVRPQPRHWHWNSTSTKWRITKFYPPAHRTEYQWIFFVVVVARHPPASRTAHKWSCLPLGAFRNDDCTWPFCSAMQWSMQSVISSNCQSQLSQQHSYTTSCVAFVPTDTAVPFNCPPSSFILIARSSQACFSPAGNFLHWKESHFCTSCGIKARHVTRNPW